MRILHVLRSPIGGLFRHVSDLASAQNILGHDVGIVCDTETSQAIEAQLFSVSSSLGLGLHRMAMQRMPSLQDMRNTRHIRLLAAKLRADIVHGHGAKGGLYARLSGQTNVYTPHGGSLHYQWRQPAGAVFLAVEKFLQTRTSGFIFVCRYEQNTFNDKLNTTSSTPQVVIYNGLRSYDFEKVPPQLDACEFLFVGEMREIKGVDVLLQAMKILVGRVPDVRICLVGDGPDLARFQNLSANLELPKHVQFAGRLNFKEALARGRTVVLPSRAESFPYVMLETVAAGRVLIASEVGGIREFLPSTLRVPSENPQKLAEVMHDTLKQPTVYQSQIDTLRDTLAETFSDCNMAEATLSFYNSILLRKS